MNKEKKNKTNPKTSPKTVIHGPIFLHLDVSIFSSVVAETGLSTLANAGGSPTKAERAFR